MRVLFSTLPFAGHFHPLVPIARALIRAGHDVAFACAASFVAEVERAGFVALPAGYDFRGRGFGDVFPEWHTVPEHERVYWTIPHIFAGAMAPAMADDLLSLAPSWGPDVLVRDAAEFGGCVAAEVLGVPHALVWTDSVSSSYAHRHVAAPQLAELRAHHGLPPDPDMVMLHRYLDLACQPPRFHLSGEAPAPTAHLLRPDPAGPARIDETPGWIRKLPSSRARPLVYATLGTAVSRRPSGRAVFEAILRGLGEEPIDLVLTIGRANAPEQFGELPPNVRIERFIPQHLVFPHCDLAVTHAGFNTVAGALDFGVPMVLLPISADQPYNARCCDALGVARVIAPGEQTPEAIRAAVRAVLSDGSYRNRAKRISDEMAAMPGPDEAVRLLERLSLERQPLLASRSGENPPVSHQ